ncbi:MAG: aminoglycoside phosphotransferase family protein [Christensenellales bacterium]
MTEKRAEKFGENGFVSLKPIENGWSEDEKYCAENADGEKFLLRISSQERYEKRKALFEMLQKVAALDIPMCRPVDFGLCEGGVYMSHTWIDGVDANEIIPGLDRGGQYAYGLDAGRILRKIHGIPAPENQEDWQRRFNRKMDGKIKMYEKCPIKFVGADRFVEYIEENRGLLAGRPQSFQHGDYHIGNMMLEKGVLTIIDFDRFDFGDPWEEFNRIVWCAQAAPAFAGGMVDGYFNGKPPMEFWRLLALYIASNSLSSVAWAVPFGQKEVAVMLQQMEDVLRWYEGMKEVVPAWYCGGR